MVIIFFSIPNEAKNVFWTYYGVFLIFLSTNNFPSDVPA